MLFFIFHCLSTSFSTPHCRIPSHCSFIIYFTIHFVYSLYYKISYLSYTNVFSLLSPFLPFTSFLLPLFLLIVNLLLLYHLIIPLFFSIGFVYSSHSVVSYFSYTNAFLHYPNFFYFHYSITPFQSSFFSLYSIKLVRSINN